jgi:hypothetical protein
VRRLVVLFSAAFLSLIGAVVGTSAVASGTDTTVPSDEDAGVHPVVGTWVLTLVGQPEDEAPFSAVFLSDGAYLQGDVGSVGVGVWEATGPDTAALTFTEMGEDGSSTIRGSITVDGDTLSADFTIEVHGEGAPGGEYGPGQVTGTRVFVEPMGTPVGSLEELFGGFEDSTEVDDSDGGGEFAGYCALVADLDAQEGSPTPEQLEELRELAPEEISAEINAIVDGFLEQGAAFFGSEEAAELFEPIEAFEAENCPLGAED